MGSSSSIKVRDRVNKYDAAVYTKIDQLFSHLIQLPIRIARVLNCDEEI